MVARFVRDLHLPISRERLETYRPIGGSDLEMVTTYFWNVAMSEALYPTIQVLEVTLRNGIHSAASGVYQTPFWFDRPNLLLPRELDAVIEARSDLAQSNKPHNAGRIVAALRFGFWTSLRSRPYERRLWRANNLALLRVAFPHLPRRYRARNSVWQRGDDVRRLRNRVMHAEPVWNRQALLSEHGEILDAIGWVSPPLLETITRLDRFPDVYQNGRPRIEATIKTQLGIR